MTTVTRAEQAGLDRIHGHISDRLAVRKADADRQLLAAASRALREAGWVPDYRICAEGRNSRSTSDGRHLVAWTPAVVPGAWELEIWHPFDGTLELTFVPVTSVQQAVDVVAALLGVGVHLTTGARLGGRRG